MKTDKNQNKICTIKCLLSTCNELGIPHFQRGYVWNDSNVASLLESLYFDTPCGSIILWKKPDATKKAEDLGISLVNGNDIDNVKYFLVDGQQRTRSLYSVFCKKDDIYEDGDSEIPYVWAVNLAAFEKILLQKKEQEPVFKTNSKTPNELFVKIRDPLKQKQKYEAKKKPGEKQLPEYQYQYNYVPLRHFFDPDNIEIKQQSVLFEHERYIKNCKNQEFDKYTKGPIFFLDLKGTDQEKNAEDRIKKIRKELEKILGRELNVKILETADMSDVIHTFIRINGGGRPVQEEEKTLARLVELCPEKLDDSTKAEENKGSFAIIRDLFNTIHPEESTESNEHLMRMKENQFGFKLFIRVFVLAANYHTGKAVGSQSMSFSVIHENDELKQEAENKTDSISKIWGCVKNCVIAVKELLESELHFDTLAFLPGTRPLWPIFLLLIKYPDFMDLNRCAIKECYKKHFAYILLHLLLDGGESEKDIMQFVKALRNAPFDGSVLLKILTAPVEDPLALEDIPYVPSTENADKIRELLQKDIENILKAWNKIRAKNAEGKLKDKFENANALTNRYVLLLYVLERELGAEDFYGASLNILKEDNCRHADLKKKFGSGRKIQAEIRWSDLTNKKKGNAPEKQHLVPYVCLHSGDEDSMYEGRISNDISNNIGNITYISHELNHYDSGIGMYWLNLACADEKLKEGHILYHDALEKYEKLESQKYKNGKKIIAQKDSDYAAWITQRQSDIAKKFCEWLEALLKDAKKKEPEFNTIKQALQIIAPSPSKGKYEFDSIMGWIWQQTDLSNEKKIALASLHNESQCYIKIDNKTGDTFRLGRKGTAATELHIEKELEELLKEIKNRITPTQEGK